MHDLDRVMFETGNELAGEGPHQEFLEILGESESEAETLEAAQEYETYETELATELLEVSNEAELEQFLGNLISRAAGAARSFAASPTGRQLGGILKDAAKKALPVVGGAVGNWASPGGGGQKWGQRIGAAAGDLLGLELEGLSNEDRELEVARGFVRFANAAARNAARAPRTAPPAAVVGQAVQQAAAQYAPGLLATYTAPGYRRHSGRWVRKGDAIVLYGV